MATKEQIEKFVGEGKALRHDPPWDEIPYDLIQSYSPNPDGDFDFYIAIKIVEHQSGQFFGHFHKLGKSWNPFAIELLESLTLDYVADKDALVGGPSGPLWGVGADDEDKWILVRIEVSVANNIATDKLLWRNDAIDEEYSTEYDWVHQ